MVCAKPRLIAVPRSNPSSRDNSTSAPVFRRPALRYYPANGFASTGNVQNAKPDVQRSTLNAQRPTSNRRLLRIVRSSELSRLRTGSRRRPGKLNVGSSPLPYSHTPPAVYFVRKPAPIANADAAIAFRMSTPMNGTTPSIQALCRQSLTGFPPATDIHTASHIEPRR